MVSLPDPDVVVTDCVYCGALVQRNTVQHMKWHYALALLIFCPVCKAKPGEDCFNKLTNTYTYLHDERVFLK